MEAAKVDKAVSTVDVSVFDSCQAVIQKGLMIAPNCHLFRASETMSLPPPA